MLTHMWRWLAVQIDTKVQFTAGLKAIIVLLTATHKSNIYAVN